ncbi:hypothetical protein AT1219_11024 [Vibrio alginolyticus]
MFIVDEHSSGAATKPIKAVKKVVESYFFKLESSFFALLNKVIIDT